MEEHQWLAEQFEANRSHLQTVAYRMLGSASEANDVVQESWLRLSLADASGIENLGGWLTTVVARLCLDVLRARNARREKPLDDAMTARIANREPGNDPEREALLADSLGFALLVILDTLTPAERIAFVLHDIFAMPFDEIAPILDRSASAVRQLASRARRRVQSPVILNDNLASQREVVNAFLTASREGSFEALLAVLDPDVVFRNDPTLVSTGAATEIRGAASVAKQFVGRARGVRPSLVDGAIGVLVARQGRLFLVISFKVTDGKITEINAIGDPARFRKLRLAVLEN